MKIRKVSAIVFAFLFVPLLLWSQTETIDLTMVYRIKQEGSQNSKMEDLAFGLTDLVGPRLTGSTGNSRANEWAKKKMEELRVAIESGNKELDYHRFLLDELVEAGLRENEMKELEAELNMLSHAEQIKSVLGKLYFQLEESEQPMVPQLKAMLNQLLQ